MERPNTQPPSQPSNDVSKDIEEAKQNWIDFLTPKGREIVENARKEHEKMMRFIKDLEEIKNPKI